MPFPLRTVSNRDDISDIFDNNPTNLLQKTSVSNMIGLLNQLNQISSYATEIFQDVLKSTSSTGARIRKCKSRINNLQKELPKMESMLLNNAPSYFYDNPYSGKEYLRNDPLNGLLFSRSEASELVNRRRKNGVPPPDLSKLDSLSQNGPCIKKYTDTDFFINEWLKNEKIKREEAKKQRELMKRVLFYLLYKVQ